MKRTLVIPVLVLLMVAGAVRVVQAQPRAVESEASLSTDDQVRAALAAMRRSLLDLASLQEMQAGTSKRYTADLDKLGYRPAPGVDVRVLEAKGDGWSGVATHPDAPGRSCVIYFGNVTVPETAGGKKPARPKALACDS